MGIITIVSTLFVLPVYLKFVYRKNNTRMNKRQRKYDPKTRLSHKLSSILRHGNDGFTNRIDNNGWLPINQLLEHSNFCKQHGITRNDIEQVVKSCQKQRFRIEHDRIRATQGHTINIEDTELKELTSEDLRSFQHITHGTYYKSLDPIRKDGLCKMQRNHIHLTASDKVGEDGVISGFRASTQVLIYIDAVKASDAGIKFFQSSNNVILTAGDENGYLKPQFFIKIIDRNTGNTV